MPTKIAQLRNSGLGEGDYPTARALFEQAIALRPDFVWATVELTRCYSRLDQEIAMAACAARAINIDPISGIDPIGSPATAVASILAAHWKQRKSPSEMNDRRWRPLRRTKNRHARQQGPLDDFIAARDMPSNEAILVLERILATLNDESADYYVVLETLADRHFHANQHDLCVEYSRRAVSGLVCVRALILEPRRYWAVEAGSDHDAKAVYKALIQNLFNEEPHFVVLKADSNRVQDIREAMVSTAAGTYEIRRGGNLFIIVTPAGTRVLHEAFDRSDLALGGW